MEDFMVERYEGGAIGVEATLAVAHFVNVRRNVLEYILTEHDVRQRAALDIVKALKKHLYVDTCGAMFVHGKMSLSGYQLIFNQMCKQYWYDAQDKWEPLRLPHRVFCPKLAGRDTTSDFLEGYAE
eukprot:jgi/Tetstr1/461447/TSEL_006556.t1